MAIRASLLVLALLAGPASAAPPLHLINTAPCSFSDSDADSFLLGVPFASQFDPCVGPACATSVDIVDSRATATNLVVQSPPVPALPDWVGYELSTTATSWASLPNFVSDDTLADADGFGQACLAVTALEPMWLDFEWDMGVSNNGIAGNVTRASAEVTKNGIPQISRTIESFGNVVSDDEFGFEIDMDTGDVVVLRTTSLSDSIAFVGTWTGVAFTDVLAVVPEPGGAAGGLGAIVALGAIAGRRRRE